ncbi:hypothetical protein DV738_g1836, partial [Chaetothyriales sp. CBS 135597]
MPSSQRSYSIIEPHPSAQSNTYIYTGRGGAGNFTKTPSSVTRGADASGPASRLPPSVLSSHHPKAFLTGRGGAGNVQSPSERAIFSFDEELERELSRERHAAPVYHVGRGGSGNRYALPSPLSRPRPSDDQSSARSTSSAESGADYATKKMTQGWKKLTGKY